MPEVLGMMLYNILQGQTATCSHFSYIYVLFLYINTDLITKM